MWHCNVEQQKMHETFALKRQALIRVNQVEQYKEFRKMQDEIESSIIEKIQNVMFEKTGVTEDQIGEAFLKHSENTAFK